MKFSTLVLVGLCSLSFAAPALAHIKLLEPKPRVPNTDAIKMSPCGPASRDSANVSTFAAGQTIKMRWQETISHSGYFRVLLGQRGDTDLPIPTMAEYTNQRDYYNGNKATLPPTVVGPIKQGNTWVLTDYWSPHAQGQSRAWDIELKLPDVTCDNCTLQLVQGMFENNRPYSNAYYYHCADLIIKAGSTGSVDAGAQPPMDAGVVAKGGNGGHTQTGGRGGGAGGSGEGGGDDDDDGADDKSSEDEPRKSKGGCMIASEASPASAALCLLPLMMFFLRRRCR